MRSILFTVSMIVVALFVSPSHGFALGGGGFRNEAALDAEANGMAGVFVAQADSPSALHFNPAGLLQLKGDNLTVGYTMQAPRNSYTDLSGNESQMQRQSFLIPSFYFVSDFGCEDWRYGFSITSPYGLGTDWADDSFSRFQATESNLEFYQINPTAAYQVNDKFSVGFGVDYIVSYISKHKRINDGANGDFHLKGDDDAWGYNIGLLYKPSDRHSLGISYRSKIELTYEGWASLDNMSNGIYAALFPNVYTTEIESDLTLPRSIALGYAYKPSTRWTFELDFEWTDWTSVQEDFIRYTTESDTNRLAVLNAGNPAAKDWHGSLAYGIGVEHQTTDRLALRAGYAFYETPIPSANFETALPDADRHGLSLGLGYKLNDGLTIDASYFGVLFVDRKVTNDVASASSDLDGEYEGYVSIFSVGFTYRY